MKRQVWFLIACMLAAATAARADTVIGTMVRGGNDLANWGQLGACGTDIPNNFGAVSNGGVGITGTFAQGGPGQLRQQSNPNCVWNGNFASGDNVLWTNSPGQAPLTLSFSRGVSGAGAQIQADFPGAFTAQVCDNFGDCFQENGNSNFNGDNSAIFIGLQDLTGPNITSFTFSLTSCVSDCNDFGINQLSLGPIPEPGTLILFGSGLLSLGGFLRRQVKSLVGALQQYTRTCSRHVGLVPTDPAIWKVCAGDTWIGAGGSLLHGQRFQITIHYPRGL